MRTKRKRRQMIVNLRVSQRIKKIKNLTRRRRVNNPKIKTKRKTPKKSYQIERSRQTKKNFIKVGKRRPL